MRGYVGIILLNLSKALKCLSHDLKIAKLEACGLDISTLNFLLDHLSLRKHRTRVGSSYRNGQKFAEEYRKAQY